VSKVTSRSATHLQQSRANYVIPRPRLGIPLEARNARFIMGPDQRLPWATTDEHGIATHSPEDTIDGGDA